VFSADAVFIATHSQGSVVSTHLLDRLIADGHLRTSKNWEIIKHAADPTDGGINVAPSAIRPPQKVCCLALCGIHLGPLLYFGTSSLVNPYLQYFESAAAKELFEFQVSYGSLSLFTFLTFHRIPSRLSRRSIFLPLKVYWITA
jgi:hypothetical protein